MWPAVILLPTLLTAVAAVTKAPENVRRQEVHEPNPPTYDDACNIGYCSVNGATIGGWGGPYVTVTTVEQLKTAVASTGEAVVLISGHLVGDERVTVGSSKSILGLPGSSLTGISLSLPSSRNVILRNLNISRTDDAITITSGRSIWVDHCDLSASRGNLVSITHGSDYITVTHNLFHDHTGVAAHVGHSDTNAAEDKGKLHVTFARNYFKKVKTATSFRFGTGHVFNSLFEGVESGVNTRMGADVLIEASLFEGSAKAVFSAESSEEGFATVVDVVLGNATSTAPKGKLVGVELPYPYDWYVWGTENVKKGVVSQAGQVLEFMTWDR